MMPLGEVVKKEMVVDGNDEAQGLGTGIVQTFFNWDHSSE